MSYINNNFNMDTAGDDSSEFIENTVSGETIQTGSNDDTIKNTANNVSINSGAGKDSISNSGSHVTINGGSGNNIILSYDDEDVVIIGGADNDVISLNGGAKNNSVYYSAGDGNDTVYGFDTNDDLVIDSSYSTQVSGSDLLVNVGTGSIKLVGATSLSTVKINKTLVNPVFITLTEAADTYVNELNNATIEALGGSDNIDNSGSYVLINGGAGHDYIKNTEEATWATLNGGAGNDYIDNYGSNVIIDGGSDNDSIYTYAANVTVDAGSGNDYVYNTGSKVSITGGEGKDTLKSYGANVFISGGAGDDSISNGGGTTESSNVTLDAGAGNDTIYNGWNTDVSVNGGAGNDSISNVNGKYATLSGGAGNDTIVNNSADVTIEGGTGDDSISSTGNNVVFVYSQGDGSDTIEGFNSYSTLQIGDGTGIYSKEIVNNDVIVTVENGTITLKNASKLSKVNIAGTEKYNWSMNSAGTAAVYGNAQETLITVSGVKSVSGISIRDKIVTVPASVLNAKNVTVSDGYTLSTDGIAPSTTNAWSLSGTNANYVQTTTAGYTLSSDGKSISYTPNSSKTLITVAGVKSANGISLNGKIVNVPAAVLNGTKVTVSDGYTLSTDGAKPSTTTAWSLNGTNANYVQTTSAGYTLASDGKSISYTPNSSKTLVTVAGVKSANGISLSGKVVNVPAAALNATNVTVSDGYTLSTDGTAPSTTNAWSLSGTNANYVQTTTAGYTLASDGKSISYTPNSSKTLITVAGVKSVSGISLSGKVVNIPASVLNGTKVTVSDGYTLSTSGTAPSTKNAWSLSGTNANYVQTTTAGYTLSSDGKSISYTPNSSKTLITVAGVKSANGISLNGKIVNVPAAALNGTKVTVSDGYTLSTDGAKPSTTNAWSLSGTNANYVQTTTAGYTLASDGKSISYTPNSSKTLATVAGVKSVSGISLNGKVINVPAAVLNGTKVTVSDGYTLATNGTAPTTKAAWSLNGTNANYVQTTTAGYTLSSDGKSISYTPNSSKTLATVKGVKSTKGLSISGKVITVAKSSLNATKITVGNGYTLALASDVTKPSTKNAWSSSGTTATYKQTKSAGYTLASNAKSIAYNKKSTTTLATVKGVKSTKGLSVSGKVITVAKASLNAAKITVSSGYTLALASDASKPTTKKAAWNLSGTTATYKSSYKTAGYTLASNKKSIAYSKSTSAKNLATVKGAKSKTGLSISGKRITLKNSALNKKVTVSGGYEFDFAADYKNSTITGSGNADTIIARGSKISVNGGKGDDTIKILGTGTVTGGAGADIFYYKSSGKNVISDYAAEDKISIASGKAATATSGDDLVLTVGKGKITVVGGKSKTVTYYDAGGEHTYKDTSDGVKFNAAGTGVTLTADYSEDVFDLSNYPDYKNKVVTINAAKVTNALEIVANKKANKITGSNENDTIDGGASNDKIYGGAGDDSLWGNKGSDTLYGGAGDDIFLYRDGDGNDVIADFELGDKIQVIAKDIGFPTAAANGDVTFTVGSGKIVIKGGADKPIRLYGENGGELAQRYNP